MYIDSIKFSLWCDFLERSFINDELDVLIQDKIVNGATSNPSIFNLAFLNSQAYKEDIASLQEKKAKDIYETLAFADIKAAAKKLLALYKKGDDGFVSIEVDPFLANDAKMSYEEGKRIFKSIAMPNVMIKIPATKAGCEAIENLMAEGINVNATLVFSPQQACLVLESMKNALEKFAKSNSSLNAPKGVISVFVSRFDRKLDTILRQNGLVTAKVGIMNALKIYNLIQKSQNENIRTLFASTGVKEDDLEKDYYIKELLYPNTINTAPLDAINAFLASGTPIAKTIVSNEEIDSFFDELKNNDIHMDKLYDELMNEGMKAFEEAFTEILKSVKL